LPPDDGDRIGERPAARDPVEDPFQYEPLI
jgi:hypothetical protein